MTDIIELILQGDVRASARLIRQIDDGRPDALDHLKKLYGHSGRAFVLGITGSPGVGKSVLTDCLVQYLREQDLTVGVLAVDPTSPFTGGAILGDRLRMQRHSADPGVFIRSIATRGQFGGLTWSTRGAITVLDAMGRDIIIVETVGVGQDEVDITRAAHTTIIVTAPGLGDDVQAAKAGILEIGDVFVVNKADREGADRAVRELETMIELGLSTKPGGHGWTPPVLKMVASQGEGVTELWEMVNTHRDFLARKKNEYAVRAIDHLKCKMELCDLVRQQVVDTVMKRLDQTGDLDRYVDEMMERKVDPYTLSERILADYRDLS